MKLPLLTILFLFLLNPAFTQNRKIEFDNGSFSELKAKAKKENKLIFIDAFTTWCGPCKWMAANIFTNDTVADYYNSKLINAKIDMEKGEGIEIAEMYNVSCYPTYLFLDGDGNLLHRSAGTFPVKDFVAIAETAEMPDKRFAYYINNYEQNKTNYQFLLEYLEVNNRTCLVVGNILADYYATQKEEQLISRANWSLMFNYVLNYDSREFKFLVNHYDEFCKLYTADSVNRKITSVFTVSAYEISMMDDTNLDDLTELLNQIKNSSVSNKDYLLFEIYRSHYELKNSWEEYGELLLKEGDKNLKELTEFNNVCWNVYENIDDPKVLAKAEEWMKKALTGNNDPKDWYCYDTYAAILYKLKKKEPAREAAQKAIALAQESGLNKEGYQATTDLLKEIENLK